MDYFTDNPLDFALDTTHPPPSRFQRAPGVALWKAVRNSQRNWFLALLLLNTLAILEIIYIFFFSKKEEPK